MVVHDENGYNFAVYPVNNKTFEPHFNKKVSALQKNCNRLLIRQNGYNRLNYNK